MGALLGKFGKVDMYFPGGCSIGARPINLHLKGFELLGAKITEEDNHFIIEADKLKGNLRIGNGNRISFFFFPEPSNCY